MPRVRAIPHARDPQRIKLPLCGSLLRHIQVISRYKLNVDMIGRCSRMALQLLHPPTPRGLECMPSISVTPSLSEAQARCLLNALCVKYGFCLSPLWSARLTRNPPNTSKAFTDTVSHAEGLDPLSAESSLYAAMQQEVAQAFQASAAGWTHD